jgi:SAM-dependent methyltransferase
MDMDAFLRFHEAAARQGPGTAADVAWAVAMAGTRAGARVLDAGAGVGADIPALQAAIPGARIVAVEAHGGFVRAIAARFGADVVAVHGAMGPEPAYDGSAPLDLPARGPFDLIWCAGAIYFLGVATALRHWAPALAPGGAVAFSAPVMLTETPSAGAVAFWQGDPVQTVAQVQADVAAAGWRILAERRLPDAGWEAYYAAQAVVIAQMRAAIATGREGAGMAAVLDEAAREAALWRAHRDEVGYHAVVAVPG